MYGKNFDGIPSKKSQNNCPVIKNVKKEHLLHELFYGKFLLHSFRSSQVRQVSSCFLRPPFELNQLSNLKHYHTNLLLNCQANCEPTTGDWIKHRHQVLFVDFFNSGLTSFAKWQNGAEALGTPSNTWMKIFWSGKSLHFHWDFDRNHNTILSKT